MQVGLWAISELSGGGELKERGREGALGCDSQEAGPARHPGGDGRRPQQARHGSGAMACKEAQELHGLAPKPAADLNPDDNQAAASGVAKFGVRLMPLAACRICHPAARLDVGARVCLTKTCEGGNNSGIDGELGSMPKQEAVRDNLDAPLVGDGHVEVHVGEADVASNSRPGLPAHARDSMLKGQGTCGQDARGGARGTVIAVWAKLSVAAASARHELQGHAPAPQQQQQQHAELGW